MAAQINKAATETKMSELHGLTADLMQKRLQAALDGKIEIPPAELGAIIKFLRDNGIECVKDDLKNKFGQVLELVPPTYEEIEEQLG